MTTIVASENKPVRTVFEAHDYGRALYISGEFVSAASGKRIDVLNPAKGEVFQSVSYGDIDDVDRALSSAEAAFPSWSRSSIRMRADLLNEVARLLRNRKEVIGAILCQESGKRRVEAIAEVNFAAEYFQWFAEEIRRPCGSIISGDSASRRQWEIHEPCGVVGLLTPWNFPISIQARKLAPALAAGCTVVSRPSEKAPCSVVELFRCLHDAGIPAGVAQLVLGPPAEVTQRIFSHSAVRLVSFTGSTGVGKQLMRLAADRVVRLSLELGGNAAFIVHSDADIDAAVDGAVMAKFRNNGQSCIAANRLLIHENCYREFVNKFVSRVERLRVGNPMDDDVDIGPLIDASSQDKLERAVRAAIAEGAEVLNTEMRAPEEGSYVVPRVLAHTPINTFLGCEEIFGPIAVVSSYTDIDEVIEMANRPNVGLASYAYTRDLRLATRLTEALRVGIVGLNNALPAAVFAPMGGMKESGFGREGAQHGLREFQEIKYVSMEL